MFLSCIIYIILLLLTFLALSSRISDENQGTTITSSSNTDHKSNDESEIRTTSTSSSIVVCGVDGIIYIFNAWDGELRGLFSSGKELISSSYEVEDDNRKQQIVPGLDGHIYKIQSTSKRSYDSSSDDEDDEQDNFHLEMLPFSVKDLIDSPVSACENFASSNDNDEDCGLVTGSKQSTIFALDVSSGTVAWTQKQPSAKTTALTNNVVMFSPHSKKNIQKKESNRNVLLLQREDYFVHQVNVEKGIEDWNATVSSFQALDIYPKKRTKKNTHRATFSTEQKVDNLSKSCKSPTSCSLLTENLQTVLHKNHPVISSPSQQEDQEFHKKSFQSASFPAIAFGRDGKSVIVMDPVTHEFLWKRQLDTVVAAVYGSNVDEQESQKWMDISVFDENDVLYEQIQTTTYDNDQSTQKVLLPPKRNIYFDTIDERKIIFSLLNKQGISHDFALPWTKDEQLVNLPSEESTSLIPYYFPVQPSPSPSQSNPTKTQITAAKLDAHQSTLFVSSVIRNSLSNGNLENPHKVQFPMIPLISESPTMIPVLVDNPSPKLAHIAPVNYIQNPQSSFKTPQGLFLTWRMIVLLLASLCIGLYIGRILFKNRYKKKVLQELMQKQEERSEVALISRISPKSNSVHAKSFLNSSSLTSYTSLPNFLLRSHSMGEIEAITMRKRRAISNPENDSDSRSILRTNSAYAKSASVTNTVSPTPNDTDAHDLTNVKDEKEKGNYIRMMNGIPFLANQYSRYKSEFEELEQLGKGGFGTVYRCRNVVDGCDYAIKKIYIFHPNEIPTVLREVKILALLNHPNIVRYFTAWLEVEENGKDDDNDRHDMDESNLSASFSNGTNSFSKSEMDHHILSSPFSQGKKISSSFLIGNRSNNVFPEVKEDIDLGFDWDHDSSKTSQQKHLGSQDKTTPSYENSNFTSESYSSFKEQTNSSSDDSGDSGSSYSESQFDTKHSSMPTSKSLKRDPKQKHVLYIQMQFCSQNTLTDWITQKNSKNSDILESIPNVLKLFNQIIQGVKHVHQLGLIHRDLKPSNCFVDKEGVVKIGDFGLSRELSAGADSSREKNFDSFSDQEAKIYQNTAGIGTRSYASPEQINGSDYNESTDIYSLGVMIFELCYPINTQMEKFLVFQNIRKRIYPDTWNASIADSLPSLHQLVHTMLSPCPSERPTSVKITDAVNTLLKEYTISTTLSINQSSDSENNEKSYETLLLRIEAADNQTNQEDEEGIVLQRTIQLIKEAISNSSPAKIDSNSDNSVIPKASIVQYGLLRSQESKIVMEFELNINKNDSTRECDGRALPQTANIDGFRHESCNAEVAIKDILSALQASDEIKIARQVTR